MMRGGGRARCRFKSGSVSADKRGPRRTMQRSMKSLTLAGLAGVLAHVSAGAADKSEYHLFHPTPADQLRELSTDRPDKTESPYTVDAGRMQVEADLVTYTRDRDTSNGADTRVEGWAVAPINLKFGLTHRIDLQTVVESWQHVTTEDRVAGTKNRQSGFGDVTTRVKVNLWGNDDDGTALALMPYVKYPTNQDDLGNDDVEGGLIVPFSIPLPREFDLTLMTQLDVMRNAADDGHHAEFVNTITVGHAIVGDLSGYLEFFSSVSTDDGAPWVGTVDIGFTYGLTENVQLDAGVNIGVTESADDWNPFLGLSFRY